MTRSLTGFALKGLGVALLVVLVLGAVATIVGIVLGFVATIVSLVLTVAVLCLFVLAAIGLASLLRGDDEATEFESTAGTDRFGSNRGETTASDDRDPAARLHERYVDGEIDEAELERQIDRLYRTGDAGNPSGDGSPAFEGPTRDVDRSWDR